MHFRIGSLPARLPVIARFAAVAIAAFAWQAPALLAQDGRIFRSTPETVAIWEFNDLGVDVDTVLPDGTVIPDLSGNGLDAEVERNGGGEIALVAGDEVFDGDNPNTAGGRIGGFSNSNIAVNDDGGAFEMDENQDFAIELYVRRAEVTNGENWGILAGTWHSRTLINDALDPNADGAWYGYGFIRHNEGGGWAFTCSPIRPDGTFTPSFNELASARFEIPEGPHYVVASVDRVAQLVSVYLDGDEVGTVGLPPNTAFITPPGYDHARFMFLNGEDDASRNSYRPAPSGYAIDAARVQKRAMTPEEVFDNWILLQDGVSIPDTEVRIQAVATTTARNALVGQCVGLSGANSTPGEGATITKYEWKIGNADFVVGEATREVSFDAPSGPNGIEVELRVTDSKDATASAKVAIVVSHVVPTAIIQARRGDDVLGSKVILGLGDVLRLDGTSSFAAVPVNAFTCPIVDGVQIPVPLITEYRWDLDSNGTVDSTQASNDLPPAAVIGTSRITLTVVTESGGESRTSIDVEVIEVPDVAPAPPGRIFLPTEDTVAIWEFNDLPVGTGEAVPDGTVIPDLSGNGLDAVVEANESGAVGVADGDPSFDENTACGKLFASDTARIVVNDDGGEFEMASDQDFSIELYVRRAEEVGGENWGILAGNWHSRTLLDDGGNPDTDGAWYGYGFIRHTEGGGWRFTVSPIQPDGSFTPSFNEILTHNFEIPPGSHYVVATVDRAFGFARAYLDGVEVGNVRIPDGLALITPTDYDPARFMFLTGEDDSSRGAYRAAPSGYFIDAARVRKSALTADEIRESNKLLRIGIAVPPSPPVEGTGFVRGDADGSGAINITDGIFILNFLFLGGGDPPCRDAADPDDSGSINITDGIYVLNFLFLGGDDPLAPHPACGIEANDNDGLSCDAFAPCAG
jgi:hypothetical protein